MKNYKYDSEIADLVLTILNNGNFHNETINESILVKLYQLRGTPLKVNTELYCRDVEEDWKGYQQDSNVSL